MAKTPPKKYEKSFDEPTRRAWAIKILNGETTTEVARKELNTTTWTVRAWIGEEVEKRIAAGTTVITAPARTASVLSTTVPGMVEERASDPEFKKLTSAEREVLAKYMGGLMRRLE